MRHLGPFSAAILGFSLLTACKDDRKVAITELVAIAQQAPWTVGAPNTPHGGYTIVVEDAALPAYNQVFAYFDPRDSSRTTRYRELPSDIMMRLPIVAAEPPDFEALGGDTMRATLAFRRPPRERFIAALAPLVSTAESLSPTPATQAAFTAALRRVRSELSEPDTAFITAVSGPRIVSMLSASWWRDSLMVDSMAQVALVRFRGFVATAQVQVTEYDDYSSLSGLGYPTGAAIKGAVRPTTAGWHKPERIYSLLAVECEGIRDSRSARTTGYLLPEGPDSLAPTDFLCLWAGKEGQEWIDIRPRQVRLRLLATVGTDSLMGSWIQVR